MGSLKLEIVVEMVKIFRRTNRLEEALPGINDDCSGTGTMTKTGADVEHQHPTALNNGCPEAGREKSGRKVKYKQ